MQHFLLPTIEPRTVEELHTEPDEVSSLVYTEDAIAKEVSWDPTHPAAIHRCLAFLTTCVNPALA
jgi:hypothetical protein